MKICSTCKTEKSIEEFYSDKRRPDGLKSQCKKCRTLCSMLTRDVDRHRDYNRNWMRGSKYATREEVREREMLRSRVRWKSVGVRARALANRAVQLGFLQRPECCPACGRSNLLIHAHHADYLKPLEVTWLCSECHGRGHRRVA